LQVKRWVDGGGLIKKVAREQVLLLCLGFLLTYNIYLKRLKADFFGPRLGCPVRTSQAWEGERANLLLSRVLNCLIFDGLKDRFLLGPGLAIRFDRQAWEGEREQT